MLYPPPHPRDQILYPDSDGKPMSDNTLQFQWIVTLKENLELLFLDNPDVFVAGNILWYAAEGDPKVRQGPDVLVAFGRPKGYRGSYRQWVENGVAPHVIFEVMSPGNRPGEMTRKFGFYDRHGVEEYYVYNPETGDLEGWRRGRRRLAQIRPIAGFTSPRLKVRFEVSHGEELRIIRPDGRRFLTFSEIGALAEEQQRRADAEAQRADAEAARAERLAAKLRELGVDPAE